jgi:signal transduction histidine kinase
VTYPEDRERASEWVRRALAGELDRYRVEKRYYHKSGRIVWAVVSAALVRDAAGRPSYFVDHIQDVTEQREMERMKDEFISMVSHELRTPLTSIRGSLGLIVGANAQDLPQKVRTLLDIANNNAERLILLINDILDIDKIASGKMRFDIQEKSLARITLKAVEANEAYAQKLNVTIVLGAIDEHIRVAVDEERYIQVLSNLLSNAAKFSPRGGTIAVTAEVGAARVRVSVADQGPGIPMEFRTRIFGKFAQADSSSTRRTGGTGLGLHIAQQMIERMRGRIGFETEVGRGTTFWVELPLITAAM